MQERSCEPGVYNRPMREGAGQARLDELAIALSAEFDLGEPVRVEVLGATGHGTFKVLTPRGAFVAKRPGRPDDVALYGRVEELLNSRGITQARLLSTRTGAFVADCGYFLCEFLDGTVTTRPTRRQTLAVMSHLGDYLRALAEVDIDWQPDEKNFWSRVADVNYLLSVLPGHLNAGSDQDRGVLEAAIGYLSDSAAALGQLRTQLVHGDVAPDNVVMAEDNVVAIIDFTPFREPALFGIACALYWFHVHGNAVLQIDKVAASLEAAGRGRPWTKAELSLAPAMLVREALRRLATPLEAPEPMQISRASLAVRRRNLQLIMDALPALQEVVAHSYAEQ